MTVSIKQERITPEKAAMILETQNTRNRPLSENYVNSLVKSVRRGEWEDNGETIKFDNNGTLIDGQHRLKMLIRLGQSKTLWVARGLEPVAFETIDQAKPRSLSDVLHIRGEFYYCELASALRNHAAINQIISPRDRLSPKHGLVLLKKCPDYREIVKWLIDTEGGCELKRNTLCSIGTAAALYRLMAKKDEAKAIKFWEQIGTGEKLTKKSAAWKMRDILIQNKMAVEKMDRDTIKCLLIKAWNAYRKGVNFNRRLVAEDRTAEIQ